MSETAPTKPVNRREVRVRLAQEIWNADRCKESAEQRAREIWDSMPPPRMPDPAATRPPARARRHQALEEMLAEIGRLRRARRSLGSGLGNRGGRST